MARKKNFYHGTKSEIPVGGLIVPSSELPRRGVSNHGTTGASRGQSSKDHAFATTDWRVARGFAEQSDDWDRTGMSGHVYPVEPVGESRPGVFGYLKEHVAPAWRVTGPPEHTMPVRKGYSRQGVLPMNFEPTIYRDFKDKIDDGYARTAALRDKINDTAYRLGKDHPETVKAERELEGIFHSRERVDNERTRLLTGIEPERRIRSRQFGSPSIFESPAPKPKKQAKDPNQLELF